MDFEQHIYGMTEEGEAAIVYILRAANGAEVCISNYGASILAVKLPNDKGFGEDVVVSPANFEAMLQDREYIGRSIDWSVGLRREGLHNTMWESRFETNRVVMSHEVEGMTIEAIFDFDDDMSLEVTYIARGEKDSNIDIAPNIFFKLANNAELKTNANDFRLVEELCPKRGEIDIEKQNYQRGILTSIATLRNTHHQMEILTSKKGLNLYMGERGESIALTPRSLSQQSTPAGELYCEKVVYKFSKL
ncbi:MAG: hypothetical protein SNH35_02585 [Rikenellaceae bacterium]